MVNLINLLNRDGYVFLASYMPNTSTSEFVQFLTVKEGLSAISKIHALKPLRTNESTPNTYSGNYGFEEFPLHTDLAHWPLPPRFLLLRCKQGSSQVATRILDGRKAIRDIGARVLERALVKPRRPFEGKFPLMRLFLSGTPDLLRWDKTFIVSASPAGEHGIEAMTELLSRVSTIEVVLKNACDTLLIDNWRMLHGRSAIPANANDRVIDRVYLGE